MLQSDESTDEGVELPGGRHSSWKSAPTRIPHHGRGTSMLSWGRLVVVLGGVVGLVAQMLLLQLAWELWDLSVSLMEVWTELARKHLEITLSK